MVRSMLVFPLCLRGIRAAGVSPTSVEKSKSYGGEVAKSRSVKNEMRADYRQMVLEPAGGVWQTD